MPIDISIYILLDGQMMKHIVLLQESEFMRMRTTGMLVYLPQLDDMFQGNTVVGTTSFVSAIMPQTEINEVSSDEEGGEDDDNVTPVSNGTKRATKRATSPNKKSKSPVVRAMNLHMSSHIEIARERCWEYSLEVIIEMMILQLYP